MAQFNFPFRLATEDERQDPVLTSTARGGNSKFRRLYQAPKRRFKIELNGMSDDDKLAVEQFLTDNRMVPFTIKYPCNTGTEYTVQEEDGKVRWAKPEGLWEASLSVVEV